MSKLKGALAFGQSGGPSSVINASACGVIEQALKEDCITQVLGLHHGIAGILNDEFFDMAAEDPKEIRLLKTTPSSALGTVRKKLKHFEEDPDTYERILRAFRKRNIRYFLYAGGNDSMDTCNKISQYFKNNDYECRVMGVPKTIDNDLDVTDHCPGYPSAAKFIATSCMEIHHDVRAYDKGKVTIVEIMGRNAGWLTAASYLSTHFGQGPDRIYVPEVTFDIDRFYDDISNLYAKQNNCIIAVSEGIKDKHGKYIAEYSSPCEKDAFNNTQLGGCTSVLSFLVKNNLKINTRSVEFSLLQRCASHLSSKVDIEEAYNAGAEAVKQAVAGKTGFMAGIRRVNSNPYESEIQLIPLELVANTEKPLPKEFITENGTNIDPSFVDYLLPLIQGEADLPFENGLPRFAKLKKQRV